MANIKGGKLLEVQSALRILNLKKTEPCWLNVMSTFKP